MIVWLNPPSHDAPRVGLDQPVLRREEVASVMDIDVALRQAQALLDNAREEAASLVADAQARAAQIDEQARACHAQAEQAGREAGFAQGIEAAHAAMQARVMEKHEAMQHMGERLAGVVCRAVEQMVGEAGRDARLHAVVTTLHRMIDEQTHLVLRVHPEDVELTRAALIEMATATDWRGGFDVVPDAGAQPGDCQCEWDDGILDASLSVQLDALRLALAGAVERMAGSMGTDDVDDAHAVSEGEAYADNAEEDTQA